MVGPVSKQTQADVDHIRIEAYKQLLVHLRAAHALAAGLDPDYLFTTSKVVLPSAIREKIRSLIHEVLQSETI